MVAMVSGNGLGLFNASLNTLGGAGLFGQTGLGQANGRAVVNAATGNLILQSTDEQLSGLGQELYHLRTYNAQGLLTDADADGWRWDGERRLVLSGTRNTVGSTVTRTTGDGHEALYQWTGSGYQSTAGDGAHDSLNWDDASSEWVWTDGSRRTVERYDGTSGRLKSQTDASGTSLTYGYDANGRLNSIKDSSGPELVLVYNAAGKLERLDTRTTSGGALSRQVYYGYDAQGRLQSVTTDLTPADNSITDAKVYTTSYSYDGDSYRITSVTQSDGTSASFTYELVGADYRVKTVSDASGTTTFSYDTAKRRTDVSNGLGQVWSYYYNPQGQLTEVRTPAVNGQREISTFVYDSQGNVTQIADGRGHVVSYQYDANGNRTLERDAEGQTVKRTFNAANQLLSESRYTATATTGTPTTLYSNDLNSNTTGLNVPNITGISATGGRLTFTAANSATQNWPGVTEQAWRQQQDGAVYKMVVETGSDGSQRCLTMAFVNTQSSTPEYRRAGLVISGGALYAVWYDGPSGQTKSIGTLASSTRYTVEGEINAGGVTWYFYPEGTSRTHAQAISYRFDYRDFGSYRLLLQGETRPAFTGVSAVYVDDISVTQSTWVDPVSTSEQASRFVYDSSNRLRYSLSAAGHVTEYRYHANGLQERVIQYGSALYTTAGTPTEAQLSTWVGTQDKTKTTLTAYAYDLRGNLSQTTTYAAVDASGNGVLNAAAVINEFVYSAHGQLLQTIAVRGADRTSKTTLSSATYDGLGRVLTQVDASGTRTSVYNGSQRSLTVTNTAGLVTTQTFDTAGRLLSVSEMAVGISPREVRYVYDALGRLTLTQDPTGVRQYTLYDEAGRVSARVDGTGAVTEYRYDANGKLIQQIAYATRVDTTSWFNGSAVNKTLISQIRPATAAADRSTQSSYDKAGRLIITTDAAGIVTTHSYDGRGQLIQTQTGNRVIRYFYDAAGRQVGQLDGEGYLREQVYNAAGQLIRVTRYGNATSEALRATGTLNQLRPSTGSNLHARYYYDVAGRQIGSVDDKGFVTETVFDEAANTLKTVRYATATTVTVMDAVAFSTITAAMASAAKQTTTITYDALGRVSRREDTAGTATVLEYDTAGRLVREVSAQGTAEERSTRTRYNALGQTVSQLVGEAATRIVGGMTDAQQAAVYRQFGLSYSYDAAGRKASFTDAAGNRSVYYYDEAGRLTHTVNGAGEVSETVYNSFGEATETTRFTGKLPDNQSDLKGGTVRSGSRAARIWYTPGNNSSLSRTLGTFAAGDVITATVWFKADAGTMGSLYIGSGSTNSKIVNVMGNGQWQQLSVTFTNTVAGPLSVYIYGDTQNTAGRIAGHSVVYDDLQVNCASTGFVYKDGFEDGLLGWSNSGTPVDIEVAANDTTLSGNQAARLWHKPGTNNSIYRSLGNFKAGDTVTATVWFKADADTQGHLYIGHPTSYRLVTAYGNGQWQQLTVNLTLMVDGPLMAYLYADRDGVYREQGHSVIYDDLEVTCAAKDFRYVDGFEDTTNALAGWSGAGQHNDVVKASSASTYSGTGAARLWHETGTPSSLSRKLGSFAANDVVTATVWLKAHADTKAALYLGNSDGVATPTNWTEELGTGGWKKVTLKKTVTTAEDLYLYLNADTFNTAPSEARSVTYDDVVVLKNGNLVLADSFDNGVLLGAAVTDTATWFLQGSRVDAVKQSTVNTFDGSKALRTEYKSSNSSAAVIELGAFTAGEVVTATLWFKAAADTRARLVISGGGISANTVVAYGTGEWMPITTTGTVASNGTLYVNIYGDYDGAYKQDGHFVLYDNLEVISSTRGRTPVPTAQHGFENYNKINTASGRSYLVDAGGREALQGGLLSTGLKSLVQSIRDAAQDSRTQFSYDARGLLSSRTDAEGYTTSYAYNDWGQQTHTTQVLNKTTGANVVQELRYNRRGELIGRTDDLGGLNKTSSIAYDAFGRVISTTDALGKVTTSSYTSGGRFITVTDPISHTRKTEYDAFGRTLVSTDALGNATTYAYDDVNRVITVTTPEGMAVSTYQTRHGETLKVVDAQGHTTQYEYNKSGQLLRTVDAQGNASTQSYDNAGRLLDSFSVGGQRTTYTYDAANRVIRRQNDTAQNPVTLYAFDGQGRQVRVTEAAGSSAQRITETRYDRNSQVLTQIVDPDGLKLSTSYSYDGAGQQLTIARGTLSSPNQQLTEYRYDTLGRRLSEHQDPTGLNLTTQYKYDLEGRLTRKIDALNNSTWYVYDAAGLMTWSVSAEGQVTRYYYDGNNRVISTLKYATAIAASTLSGWGDVVSSVSPTAVASQDQRTYLVYDRDGRQRYSIDALGYVTETRYDDNGNVTETIRHNKEILTPDTTLWANNLDSNLNGLTTTGVTDNPDLFAYESGRLVVRAVDGAYGAVSLITPTQAFQAGLSYRAEITLDATLPSRFQIGVDNEGGSSGGSPTYRRQFLLLEGTTWRSEVYESSYVQTTLGTAKLNTTYVMEIETRAGGTTLYVYEKGQTRADGFKHDFNIAGWDDIRFRIVGWRNTGYNGQALSVDNLSIQARTSEVIDGQRTRYVYDSLNRQRFTIDAQGYVTETRYDKAGQVIETLRHSQAISPNTADDVASVETALAGSQPQRTHYVYDTAGRLRFTVDALRQVSETRYDALGRVTETIRHPETLPSNTPLTELDIAALRYTTWTANLSGTSSIPDITTYNTSLATGPTIRLENGSLVFKNTAATSATSSINTASKTFKPGTVYQSELRIGGSQPNNITFRIDNGASTGDAEYRSHILQLTNGVWNSIRRNGASQDTVALGLAELNTTYVVELETTSTGSVAHVYKKGTDRSSGLSYSVDIPNWDTMRYRIYGYSEPTYNNGEVYVDAMREFAREGSPPSTAPRSYTVYDAAGRVRYQIDALKGVTEKIYNDLGQIIQEKRYADPLASIPATLNEAALQSLLADKPHRSTGYVYDAVGQARFTVDALNYISETRYDTLGQVTGQYRYSETQALPGGTGLTLANLQTFVTGKTAQRWETFEYDKAGRKKATIDALNQRESYEYDAFGNRTALINKANQRFEYTYDRRNQLSAEISPNVSVQITGGSMATRKIVTQFTYDALGQLLSRSEGNLRDGTTDKPSESTPRITTYTYDALGRQLSVTDANNKTESYTYDVFGNRKTLKNKNDAIWHYSYDNLNRLTEEITPAVAVVSQSGTAAVTSHLVTSISYDSFGNVVSRMEGRLRNSPTALASNDDLSQIRTTSYGYDLLGRQTLTIQPGWYNITTGRFQAESDGTVNTFQVTSDVLYNAYGEAVRSQVRLSNTGTASTDFATSYKVYDELGRVRYDIDALNGVTQYGYQATGETLTTKRYVNALTGTVNARGYYLASEITTTNLVADAAKDRTLSTSYDALGRKTTVRQDVVNTYVYNGIGATSTVVAAASTTVYTYNALGQVTTETLEGRNSSNATVVTGTRTTYYYDAMGNRTGTVDAAGYYTQQSYNAFGQVIRQTEHNTALSSWTAATVPTTPAVHANDRKTAYQYDNLGRLSKVTLEGVNYWLQSVDYYSGNVLPFNASGDLVVNELSYDHQGNVRTQTDARGHTTTQEYNALGHVTKTIEPVRTTAKAGVIDPFLTAAVTASPTISYELNAFGQVVTETRAAGKDAGNNTQAGLTQVSKTQYDAAGHEAQSTDAGGGVMDYRVDAAGRRLEEKQVVSVTLDAWTLANGSKQNYTHTLRTTYTYDKLGQQLASTQWYKVSGADQSTKSSALYNRFGEVSGQYLNDKAQVTYVYDQAGRVIEQKNGQGVTRVDYDIAGRTTRSAQIGDATITTDDRITYTQYNALGQALKQYLPAFSANTSTDTLTNTTLTLATPIIEQSYDRWGNVLERKDARGYITRYTYNHSNQVLSEMLPETDILRENGTSYRASLIHEKRYDALGNLIQEVDRAGTNTTDINANTELRSRMHVYNFVGQLIRDVDALGYSRHYQVDVHGNRVGTKNEIGTVRVNSFDAMNRQLTNGIVRSGALVTLQTSQYDQAGRLYGEISGSTAVEETLSSTVDTATWASTTTGNVGNVRYTLFDERGNIVKTRNESKVEKTYEYNDFNRKVKETDGLNNSLTWGYNEDSYGSLSGRTDLNGRAYAYSYNAFGQVSSEQLKVGEIVVNNRDSLYYENGFLKSTTDWVSYQQWNVDWVIYHQWQVSITNKRASTLEYDLGGSRVREIDRGEFSNTGYYLRNYLGDYYRTGASDVSAQSEVRYKFNEKSQLTELKAPAGKQLVGDINKSTVWYVDSRKDQNFDTYVSYFSVDTARVDSLKYYLDELGNRRRVYLDTTNQSNQRTVIDDWYTYDKENRVRISEGYLDSASGLVVAGFKSGQGNYKGSLNTYNAAGQLAFMQRFDRAVDYSYWSNEGQSYAYGPCYEYLEEAYTYNDLGMLERVENGSIVRANGAHVFGEARFLVDYYGSLYDPASMPKMISKEYGYDSLGRRALDTVYGVLGIVASRTAYTYRGDGNLSSQLEYKVVSGANRLKQATYFNDAVVYNDADQAQSYGMYDAAGNQKGYRYVMYRDDGTTRDYRGTYVNTYQLFDAYKQSTVVADWQQKAGSPGTTTFTYNERGELLKADATGGVTFNRTFASNREGQLIARRESNGRVQSHLLFQGGQLASVGNASTPESTKVIESVTDFSGLAPSSYVVNQGDTLERIAQLMWGEASLWYLIADANGLTENSQLTVGSTLTIPNVATGHYNTATTFKPYNQAEVIGDTTPSPKLPPPPKKKKSNAIATIVMVVVAVVATVLTAGAAAMAMGAMATAAGTTGVVAIGTAAVTGGTLMGLGTLGTIGAAFIGGAIGSAASQLAGKAMGVVDHFSWKQVAVGGLTAGLMAGAGQYNMLANLGKLQGAAKGVSGWANLAGGYVQNAAIGYAANYAGSKLVGVDTSFSWKGLAASAVGSFVGGQANQALGISTSGSLWAGTARAFVSGAARSHLNQQWARGGKVDFVQVAADAFGNALGDNVVAAMGVPREIALDALKDSGIAKLYHKRVEALSQFAPDQAKDLALREYALSKDPSDTAGRYALRLDGLMAAGASEAEAKRILGETGLHERAKTYAADPFPPGFQVRELDLAGNPKGELPPVTVRDTPLDKALSMEGRFYHNWQDELHAVGEASEKIGAWLDKNKGVTYALTALELAAGPLIFAGRKVLEHSPIGQKINDLTGSAVSAFAERMDSEGAIHDLAKSGVMAVGAVAVLSLAVGGVAMLGHNIKQAVGARLELSRRKADILNERIEPTLNQVPNSVETASAKVIQSGKYSRRADVSYRPASEVNASFPEGYSPPYKPGTRVTEFTNTADDVYVRVHGEDNMARSWMMKREAIEGLTPQQIQSKYALPEVPTHMSEVYVPAGTRIRAGIVNPVFDGVGNAIQYQLLDRLPTSAFRNAVRF